MTGRGRSRPAAAWTGSDTGLVSLSADVLDLFAAHRWLVLTGAGVSTDSGIPDYRGPDATPRTPMTGQRFRGSAEARQHYWARSYLGWPSMSRTRPNATHRTLAALADHGRVTGLITQNVDGLHGAAGHREVIDLHGRLDRVICLDCGALSGRDDLQERLAALNPEVGQNSLQILPDGDADLSETSDFVVATCRACTGVLKPDVVFFGENVPPERVAACRALVDDAEALLVMGSSLHVYSGRRFVMQAAERGIPIVIVNRGETRSDAVATVKIDGGCAETLAALIGPLGLSDALHREHAVSADSIAG